MREGAAFANLWAGGFLLGGRQGLGKAVQTCQTCGATTQSPASAGLSQHLGAERSVCAGRAGLTSSLSPRPRPGAAQPSAAARAPPLVPGTSAQPGAARRHPELLPQHPSPRLSLLSGRGKQHPSLRAAPEDSGGRAACPVGGDPRGAGPCTGHVPRLGTQRGAPGPCVLDLC